MEYTKSKPWIIISSILERIISNISSSPQYPILISKMSVKNFESVSVPSISLYNYLERIYNYADCSDSCYTLAFIYIDRLIQNNSWFILAEKNIHRIVFTAIVLAIKYHDDSYSDNVTYAKIGGISLMELNILESTLLKYLKYDLYVKQTLFYQYENELELQYEKIVLEKHNKIINSHDDKVKQFSEDMTNTITLNLTGIEDIIKP